MSRCEGGRGGGGEGGVKTSGLLQQPHMEYKKIKRHLTIGSNLTEPLTNLYLVGARAAAAEGG